MVREPKVARQLQLPVANTRVTVRTTTLLLTLLGQKSTSVVRVSFDAESLIARCSSSSCPLGTQCPEHLVCRHVLAGIRLRQRTFECGLESRSLFVTHVVIHRQRR